MTVQQFTPVKRRQAAPPVFLPPVRKTKRTRSVTFSRSIEVIPIDQQRSVIDKPETLNYAVSKPKQNPFVDPESLDHRAFDLKLGVRTNDSRKILLTKELFFRVLGREFVGSFNDEIVSQCSGGVWDSSADTSLSNHSLRIPSCEQTMPIANDSIELIAGEDQFSDTESSLIGRTSGYAFNSPHFLVTPFTESQLSLMEYLRSRQWLAYSMLEFCNVYQVTFRKDRLTFSELAKLSKLLSIYVVSPVSMPSTFRFSNSEEEPVESYSDAEIFAKLSQLWQSVPGDHAVTSFGVEIDSDFWRLLCKLVGFPLVAYFLHHCRIYRPFKDSMKGYSVGKWVHLGLSRRWTMYYSWDVIGQKMRRLREDSAPTYGTVSKREVLYQRYSATRRKIEQLRAPTFLSEFGVDQLLLIVHKRLQRHANLSRRTTNRTMMTKSRSNNEKRSSKNPGSPRHWTPTSTVGSYIAAILRKMLPTRLLGSVKNHRAFYRATAKYIKTPGHSQSTVASFSKEIRLREIPWMSKVPREGQQSALMEVLEWLISDVVHLLLAHHFYATEMSGRPTTVYYFEHEVWEEVYQKQGRDFLVAQFQTEGNEIVPFPPTPLADPLASNLLKNSSPNGSVGQHSKANVDLSLSADHLDSKTKSSDDSKSSPTQSLDDSPGYVRTRYVPKPNGTIRPILNLKTINQHLQAAHHVLHQLIQTEYPRLNRPQDWIARLYAYRNSFEAGTVFYTIKADLKGCYDNANVATVTELVTQIMEAQTANLFRVERVRAYSIPKDTIRDRHAVSTLPELVDEDLLAAITDPPSRTKLSESGPQILSELPTPDVISSTGILTQVQQLLTKLPLRISRNELINFRKGIPQGSSLSLELCNVLLEEMVKNELTEFTNDDRSLLLRYVDDFLFVTTDRLLARKFEQTMLNGFFDRYGLFCSPSKVQAVLESLEPAKSMTKLVYLGREIDTRTLEVRPVIDAPLVNVRLNCSVLRIRELRRQLHQDILKLMDPLRTFQRCSLPPPPQLLRSTVVAFGKLMAHRIPCYVLTRAESRSGRRIKQIMTSLDVRQQPVSSKAVMYCLLARYFNDYVSGADFRAQLYRPAITRYYQESKRLGRFFVDLTWRKRPAGALIGELTPKRTRG